MREFGGISSPLGRNCGTEEIPAAARAGQGGDAYMLANVRSLPNPQCDQGPTATVNAS